MADVDPIEVDQETVQSMMAAGAQTGTQVVEVLGKKEYERVHLAGAIHIPLSNINRQTGEVLQREKPVIVYCYDYQ